MLIEEFEKQTKKHPHKIAIKAEKGVITYDQLNRSANRIARQIEKKYPGPEAGQRVGLLLDHGPDMIAAILGTLKVGKVYVPLSSDYPQKRLSYMLTDSGASLLLAHSSHQETARELARETGIELMFPDKETDRVPEDNHPRQIKNKELAYIMYTSGSTGKPKGVMQTHENVMYYIRNWMRRFSITDSDRMTLFSSFCHDGSVQDMFSALLGGAVLYPYDMKQREESIELSQFLARERITIWHSVPSLYSYFASTLTGTRLFKDLRFILLGGEPVREHEITLLRKNFPYSILANVYGQTESSVNSIWLISPQDTYEHTLIGEPLDKTQIFVIDEEGNPVEPLEPGEILVVCPHLSPGYWQNKEATEAVFDEEEGFGKLYWTGDLGCLLPGGGIEFLGRKDFQVKIRGFRIEPGEIESQLLKHPQVKEAVVTAREEESGEKYLCAYITANSTDPTLSTQVREFLSLELPDYMIPTYFVQLETFPLTQSKKIDRKALPAPQIKKEEGYTPPRDFIEEKLAETWAETLKIEKEIIGIDSNFFELGGHSLKATALVSKLHRVLNVKINLAQVFKTPTIRGLSGYIKKAAQDRYNAIQPVEKKEYYILSSAQKRLYILQQMQTKQTGYNMPRVIPFTSSAPADTVKEKLEQVFKKLIARHESLRTSFHMLEDEPVQKIHDQVEFQVEYYSSGKQGNRETGNLLKNSDGGESQLDKSSSLPISLLPSLPEPPKRTPLSLSPSLPELSQNFIRPFELSHAPLLRVGLLLAPCPLPPASSLLIVDIHHIITDAASQVILTDEFTSLYEGKDLPPLKLQYKDYAEWQDAQEQRAFITHQESYWIDMFSPPEQIPVLDLPTDYPRPLIQSFEGGTVTFLLTQQENQALKKLAKEINGTAFMVILSIFNIMLAKLSSQEDIIIGTPIAGRRHDDLEHIIGMFVNTLALRNFPSGDKTCTEFLPEVRQRTLQAFENQEYQFEDLVDKISIHRDTGRNPLFDVMINLLDRQDYIDTPRTYEKEEENSHQKSTAKFDLTLTAVEIKEGFLFSVEYCARLFESRTIDRIIGYFRKILALISENPGQKISQIEIITDAEKQQILYQFNDTQPGNPGNKAIHEYFTQQAEQTTDHVALLGVHEIHEKHQKNYNMSHMSYTSHLSYKELNKKSHQLAHYLIEKGVKPDTIVGVLLERSIEMIVAILGILKAGAAYLPIDPTYPQDRIQYMLKDSGAKILLTREEIAGLSSPEAFNIRPKGTSFHLHLSPWVNAPVTSLAYLLYTSGTTGKPKGVLIQHGSVMNVLTALFKKYPFHPTDTYLLKTSYVFDVSVTELFGWFWGGGRLAVQEPGSEKDPRKILDAIERAGVTHINFVPSMFNAFLEVLNRGNLARWSTLKYIFLAGEALLPGLVSAFNRLHSTVILENLYGPTEGTIYSSQYSLEQWQGSGSIPIGKPLANAKLYILDKYDHLQPIGVPGELCISGMCLSRGYLNQPELTAGRFILATERAAPAAQEGPIGPSFGSLNCSPGLLVISSNQKLLRGVQRGGFLEKSPSGRRRQKIYKTGDLARWLPDGNIEFLGRIDNQTKIRGFRIELEEIENRLLTHHKIKEAVVIDKDDAAGEKYLCAYIVASEPVEDLEQYMSQWLPNYMIPAYFIPLEQIPLTPNGKTDRKALPEPGLKQADIYVPPRDDTEKKLLEIWVEVLARDAVHASQLLNTIGIDDNFFKLGGHSLKATSLTARIKRKLNIEMALIEVFNHPTIRQLAAYIKTLQIEIKGINDNHLVLLKEEKDKTNHLFLIHDGSGEVEGYIGFCSHLDSAGGYNYWGIKADGFQHYSPQNLSITDLAQRYIKAIKQVQHSGPYRIAGWSLGGTIAFEITRQLEQMKETIDFLAMIDTPPPAKSLQPPPKFTLESELNWIKNYLPGDIYKKIENLSQFRQMWPLIVNDLEANGFDIEVVKKILAQYEGRDIQHYLHLSIGETIRYLNTLRSFNQARTCYIPGKIIKTIIHYFKASESRISKPENWNEYSRQPIKLYEITGNHYSILQQTGGIELARTFSAILP